MSVKRGIYRPTTTFSEAAVEAAKRTGQSERTIRRWTLSGKLPATKHGSQCKIALTGVEPLLDARPPDTKTLLTRLQALEDLEDAQASPGLSPHRSGAPGLPAASEAASRPSNALARRRKPPTSENTTSEQSLEHPISYFKKTDRTVTGIVRSVLHRSLASPRPYLYLILRMSGEQWI